MDSYYNTTRSFGKELERYTAQASSQELLIHAWAKERPRFGFTPESVRWNVFKNAIPITSVRRAMTNLTNAGILEKTDQQREGDHGRPCHVWRLRTSAQPLQRKLL